MRKDKNVYEIKIGAVEKDIPKPTKLVTDDPFKLKVLEIGESREYTGENRELQSVRNRIHSFGQQSKPIRKFATRFVGENSLRVWRVQ